MADQPVERKLAAIFAPDVAGCGRLIARDKPSALAQLKACRIIILIATHRGRISRPENMAHLPEGLRLTGLSG